MPITVVRNAVYVTSWIAILLFVMGDVTRARGNPRPWAWPVFAAGLAVMAIHTLLAFAVMHGWSHDAAVASTARQTRLVYGVSFGGGVYVNYVFLAVWLTDLLWWRLAPTQLRSPAITWTLRAFYMLILFNAAVVFAAGWRKASGIVLVAVLAAAWTRRSRGPRGAGHLTPRR